MMTVNAHHLAHFLHSFPFEWNMLVDECLHYLNEWDDGTAMGGHDEEGKRFLISYHLAKRTLIVHRDEVGMIDGLILFYRFKGDWTWRDVATWRPDDKDGKIIALVWMHARNNKATREMILAWLKENPDWSECRFDGFRKNKIKHYPKNVINRMTKLQLN